MTMQHESHPHDERLAALAGADPQATDDRALRDHVTACDRCRAVVDDLTLLRSALAELPDLRPSRPLQLLPPAAAPAAPRGGMLGRLRRLSAPALAAGAGLILVGAIGSSGVVESLTGEAASGAVRNTAEDNAGVVGNTPEASESDARGLNTDGSEYAPSAASPKVPEVGAPSAEAPSDTAAPTRLGETQNMFGERTAPPSGRLPWLVVLSLGVVLVGGSLLLRFTVQPRAG